jgi:hypothetical protein
MEQSGADIVKPDGCVAAINPARREKMENVLALQSLSSVADPLDDEMCWSTCSSSGCSSSSVFVPDAGCVDNG